MLAGAFPYRHGQGYQQIITITFDVLINPSIIFHITLHRGATCALQIVASADYVCMWLDQYVTTNRLIIQNTTTHKTWLIT